MSGRSAFETSGRDEYAMTRGCDRYGRGCGRYGRGRGVFEKVL